MPKPLRMLCFTRDSARCTSYHYHIHPHINISIYNLGSGGSRRKGVSKIPDQGVQEQDQGGNRRHGIDGKRGARASKQASKHRSEIAGARSGV